MAGTGPAPKVVAQRPAFGSVVADGDDRVLVAVGRVVLSLGTAEYWTLMEMLSEAARCLAGARPGTEPQDEVHA